MLRLVVGVALVVICTSCLSKAPTLPDGIYRCAETLETITVSGDKLTFHLKVENQPEPSWHDATCGYSLGRDKKIRLNGMTSAEAFDGVGRFAWHWNGTAIERSDAPNTPPNRQFTRQ
jgi:hypothetical protein